MNKFNVVTENGKDISIVRLSGELDANTAVTADDALQATVRDDNKALIIDCSELHYISSAGLGVILATLHACNHHNKGLVFYGLQNKIQNVFKILGLHKVVKMVDSEKDAFDLLNNSQ